MDRRSFLGLPLAAALAKQVMGAEKPRATLTAIEPIGEIGVAGRMYWRNGTGTFKNFSKEEAYALLQRAMHRTYVKSCNFRGDKPPEAPGLLCGEETWKAWKSWEE